MFPVPPAPTIHTLDPLTMSVGHPVTLEFKDKEIVLVSD